MATTNIVEILTTAKALDPQSDDYLKQLNSLANIMESAERFEDMCTVMGALVTEKANKEKPLEAQERNLLSVAYKNVVGHYRQALRSLQIPDEAADEDSKKYKTFLRSMLKAKCTEVLELLRDKLINSNQVKKWKDEAKEGDEKKVGSKVKYEEDEKMKEEIETQVFYLKMCGDYYRYLAEHPAGSKEEGSKEYKEGAVNNYEDARKIAKLALQPTHPTRLGLALNASVCYYEIMNDKKTACELAKKAFDEAIQKLDNLSDATYKDSTLIMQLLRDNLTIWTNAQEEAADD